MLVRWMTTIIGGVVLLSLTACAESLHQTQRMTMFSQAPENGYAGMYVTRPAPSTLVPGSGGALLATIQDSPGMGLGIDRVTPILIPIMVIPPAGRFPIPADQASVFRLQQMHRYECSSERTR